MAKPTKDIDKAYQWAIDTCNMANPYALYTRRTGSGFNRYGGKDSEGNVGYDCSSFISAALTYGGFFAKNPWFATSNERTYLKQAGFTKVDRLGDTKPGDIGWNSGHTEMCYQGGKNGQGVFMGAHTSNATKANQVCIGSSTGVIYQHAPWTELWRYQDGASGGGGLGVSDYVVAAMCGCWKRESGVNPGIWESLVPCAWDYQYEYNGKGGYGLGQWTNVGTPHGRCYNLHKYVTSNGYTDGQGEGQLAFLVDEGYWSGSSQTKGDYSSLSEFLKSTSTNLNDLVWDFLANWEGVPGNAYSERLEAAKYFLSYIQEHKNDDKSSYSWYSENQYVGFKSSQQMGNVMLIYWWFDGYSGGDGSDDENDKDKKHKRHKFWIYEVANGIIH